MKKQDVLISLGIAAFNWIVLLIVTDNWGYSVAAALGSFVGGLALGPLMRRRAARLKKRRTA